MHFLPRELRVSPRISRRDCRRLARGLFLGAVIAVGTTALHGPASAQTEKGKAQITILYDAFGKSSKMKIDWGFSAYIEYGGKRTLFDTGRRLSERLEDMLLLLNLPLLSAWKSSP